MVSIIMIHQPDLQLEPHPHLHTIIIIIIIIIISMEAMTDLSLDFEEGCGVVHTIPVINLKQRRPIEYASVH